MEPTYLTQRVKPTTANGASQIQLPRIPGAADFSAGRTGHQGPATTCTVGHPSGVTHWSLSPRDRSEVQTHAR
eukprot:9467344-Pyramimonas_sp.AAC.1